MVSASNFLTSFARDMREWRLARPQPHGRPELRLSYEDAQEVARLEDVRRLVGYSDPARLLDPGLPVEMLGAGVVIVP